MPAIPATPKRWPAIALAACLLLFIALRFAQPIQDGDLFWHMAYGQQMVDHHSLRTDHSLYSWTPASNETIYCAWTGELLFLGLWKAVGITGIFALRYLAVLAVVSLLAIHARRANLLARPETWLILLLALLGSVVGTIPKPELLSLVLWNVLLVCAFSLLRAVADRRRTLPWIYAFPTLTLIWVNTHGAFILAAPFLIIFVIVGLRTFPRREACHLAFAAALCLLAPVINPYGIRYPRQLVAFTLGGAARRPDIDWNNAFQPTFAAAGQYFHLPELLALMSLIMAAASLRPRPGRWLVVAVFTAYVPLYVLYVRSTYLLPPLFAYGVLHLVRPTDFRRWTAGVATAAVVCLSARSVYQAKFQPETGSWLGFGVSTLQPVEEAEYLAAHPLGPRICNTYNAGGYLLWRLHPPYQVMVDARSFPFLAWFNELKQFTRTDDAGVFRAFLDRHPADVALVDFQEAQTWRSFLQTPGWRPAFYGPAAAIFVHADPTSASLAIPEAAPSLQHLRNADAAFAAFDFARATGDFRTAWSLLDQLHGPLQAQADSESLRPLEAYRSAHVALRAAQYDISWQRFEQSFRTHPISGRDLTILTLLRAVTQIPMNDPRAGTLRAGLSTLQAPTN